MLSSEQVLSSAAYARARRVAVYLSMPDEVDTAPLLEVSRGRVGRAGCRILGEIPAMHVGWT